MKRQRKLLPLIICIGAAAIMVWLATSVFVAQRGQSIHGQANEFVDVPYLGTTLDGFVPEAKVEYVSTRKYRIDEVWITTFMAPESVRTGSARHPRWMFSEEAHPTPSDTIAAVMRKMGMGDAKWSSDCWFLGGSEMNSIITIAYDPVTHKLWGAIVCNRNIEQ